MSAVSNKGGGLKINQKVCVSCKDVHGNPYTQIMFVRELHNPNVVGLSYTEDSKHIIGIDYDIITPFDSPSSESPAREEGAGVVMAPNEFIELNRKDLKEWSGTSGTYFHYSSVWKLLEKYRSLPAPAVSSTDRDVMLRVATESLEKNSLFLNSWRDNAACVIDALVNAGFLPDRSAATPSLEASEGERREEERTRKFKHYILDKERDDFLRDGDGERVHFKSHEDAYSYLKKECEYDDRWILKNFSLLKGCKMMAFENITLDNILDESNDNTPYTTVKKDTAASPTTESRQLYEPVPKDELPETFGEVPKDWTFYPHKECWLRPVSAVPATPTAAEIEITNQDVYELASKITEMKDQEPVKLMQFISLNILRLIENKKPSQAEIEKAAEEHAINEHAGSRTGVMTVAYNSFIAGAAFGKGGKV